MCGLVGFSKGNRPICWWLRRGCSDNRFEIFRWDVPGFLVCADLIFLAYASKLGKSRDMFSTDVR